MIGVLCLFDCQNTDGGAYRQAIDDQKKRAATNELQATYNPDAISEVESGERKFANAAWWGYNVIDATAALQQAIRSGAEKVIIPAMGSPWIVGPIFLESNQEIYFERGVVVEALKGDFKGGGDNLFKAVNKHDIRIIGNGAVFRMHKRDYTQAPYTKSQWRHAIALHGCRNVSLEGLTVAESGGDGIYIGRGTGEEGLPYSENIHIKNVLLDGNHRQGISVVSAHNLFIENTRIINTRGTAPQAGIDFEPNKADERLSRCLLRNCEVTRNRGAGILFYLKALTNESYPVSVAVESCRVKQNRASVWVFGTKNNPSGKITFSANDFGLLRYSRRSDGLSIEYKEQVEPTQPPHADAGGPYVLEFNKTIRLDASGSYDRDGIGGIIDWAWDLDMDGAGEFLYGDHPAVSWKFLVENLGLSPGYSYPIGLEVLDDDYEWSGTATAEIRIGPGNVN